ncbi:DNA polymerase III, delta subunit [Propionibacterium sp. oral taxon 192 str. F0372]|uniref:DNA polymerase III subunit delta n=1 Tax=Propionibacterium sp. oral taxon 192 TaxID=671222 RepID=UPI0003543D0D|nr:DNA polymerase III subunit delta [Propionibacterium sp. oral taxon 192]EPH06961.1 DNA polymerase III, delta subunit [Propionibacterium sp. oral taxon 192 str. F0372]
MVASWLPSIVATVSTTGMNRATDGGWHNVHVVGESVFGTSLLVLGSESLLSDRVVAGRVAAARAEQPESEFNDVNATDLVDGRLSDIIGGSLFAPHAIVVVRELASIPTEVVPQLTAAAVAPHPELCLVLVHGGGSRGRGVLDALRKAKVSIEKADPVKPWELPRFLAREARRARIRIDEEAITGLIEAVGNDLRALVAGLEQLGSDHEGGTITVEVVRKFFAGRAEVTSFAVTDDVMAGRVGEGLEKLRWALDTGCSPVMVTSSLASSLRSLGKYLDLHNSAMPDGDIARQVGVPPWKLKDFRKYVRSWRPDAVAEAILAVAHADQQVKGGAANAHFALEQMMLSVERARSGKR